MATSTQGGSATIFQFPARGRFAASAERLANDAADAAQLPKVAFGSGWYHDEAIEAERTRAH